MPRTHPLSRGLVLDRLQAVQRLCHRIGRSPLPDTLRAGEHQARGSVPDRTARASSRFSDDDRRFAEAHGGK